MDYVIVRTQKQTVLFLPKLFCYMAVLEGKCRVCGRIYQYDGRNDGFNHFLRMILYCLLRYCELQI